MDPNLRKAMENLLNRVGPDHFYPIFWTKLQQLVVNCHARGVDYWAISGNRNYAEQNALYTLGRTVKNPDGATAAKPLGNIVTKARGGQSNHNFKIACDFAQDKDLTRAGLQPDWNTPNYKILAEEAVKLGLESGLNWTFVDAPHIQLPLSKYGIKLDDLATAYQKGGYPAVFAILDKYQW